MSTSTLKERPTARVVTLVEPRLAEQLERLASANDRSLSAEVRHALRLHLLGASVPPGTSPVVYEKRIR